MKFLFMIIFLFSTAEANNWKREYIGRCDYIIYKDVLIHAGDCNYHSRLEEKRHEEIINEIKKLSSKLK